MTTNIFWFFGFGVCFEMGKKPALYFPSLREQRGLIGHWRSMFFETCLLKINFGTCTNWLENIGQPFLSFFLFLVLSLSLSLSLYVTSFLFLFTRGQAFSFNLLFVPLKNQLLECHSSVIMNKLVHRHILSFNLWQFMSIVISLAFFVHFRN